MMHAATMMPTARDDWQDFMPYHHVRCSRQSVCDPYPLDTGEPLQTFVFVVYKMVVRRSICARSATAAWSPAGPPAAPVGAVSRCILRRIPRV